MTLKRKADASRYLCSSGSEFRSLTAAPAAKKRIDIGTCRYTYYIQVIRAYTYMHATYSRSWHKHDAKPCRAAPRRAAPFASSNGILVDVFSAILSRAALRNIYARRGARAHAFFLHWHYSSRIPLFLLSFFISSQVPTNATPAAWMRGLGSSSFGESASILPVSAFARYHRNIQNPCCLSPCSTRHPVEWTIQFLGTVFVYISYPLPPPPPPSSCRPIST